MDGAVARSRFRMYVWFVRLKWFIVQTLTAVTLIVFLLWLSVFLYGSFYYAYMPAVSHEWPVHLRFRTDCDTDGRLCSFPTANVSLTTSSQKPVLVQGQAYVVKLEMEMPESSVNQNLGMFMVQIQFYSRQGNIVFTSERSVMLHYKSFIHRTVETIFFLPSLIFRSFSQKQDITTEMSNNYFEDPYQPTVRAVVEVQSKKVEIYNVSLKIHAKFSGLRYLLFYWPTVSAFFGISSNFFFLSLIALFSWLAFLAKSSTELQKTTDENNVLADNGQADKGLEKSDSTDSDIPVKRKAPSPENLTAFDLALESTSDQQLLTEDDSTVTTVRKRKP